MNHVPRDLIQRIFARYVALALPVPKEPDVHTDIETLISALASIESRVPDMDCSVVPSSFNPDDPYLRAYPRLPGWKWDSAETALEIFRPRGILIRLPLFWQVEGPLFTAARRAGAPLFLNDRGNMPAGAAAIATAQMNTVITDTDDSFLFSSYLTENNAVLPTAWVIVHPLFSTWRIPSSLSHKNIRVSQEVHLFPGLPVFEQCASLIQEKVSLFHVSDAYVLEVHPDEVLLTSARDEPLPLYRLKLAVHLAEAGTCACGKAQYRQE